MKYQFGNHTVTVNGSNVILPRTVDCPNCMGEGRTRDDESTEHYGYVRTDACYHCQATGKVEGREVLEMMARDLAYVKAEKAWQFHTAVDPDSDFNWRMCAAENKMSQYDYRQSFMYEAIDRELRLMKLTDVQIVKYWYASEVKAGRARFDR